MGHQRLAGASLLVFANKQDIQGSMSSVEIRDVRARLLARTVLLNSHPTNPRPSISSPSTRTSGVFYHVAR